MIHCASASFRMPRKGGMGVPGWPCRMVVKMNSRDRPRNAVAVRAGPSPPRSVSPWQEPQSCLTRRINSAGRSVPQALNAAPGNTKTAARAHVALFGTLFQSGVVKVVVAVAGKSFSHNASLHRGITCLRRDGLSEEKSACLRMDFFDLAQTTIPEPWRNVRQVRILSEIRALPNT